MQVSISGKGMDVGESLRAHIEHAAAVGVTKYLDRVNSVAVVVSRESHRFRVDLHGNLGTHAGMVVRAHAVGDDVYATFDSALEKVEKQLRRYKRRITNHHKKEDAAPSRARKTVLQADVAEHEETAANGLAAGLVIAEKATDIEILSVSEAVMRMDLQDLPALMFRNAGHGGLNVVYRRADGNISWVDPEEKVA